MRLKVWEKESNRERKRETKNELGSLGNRTDKVEEKTNDIEGRNLQTTQVK